ncbi:SGNH/GDSL hydrolase family protein [Pedobacter arcticus]|uniref:SGNH/GDSL hydrolase family protein n=1 Tax=Pedobacter arcticus TaxID=752140 RepID=UPI0002D9750E|nr:SGNH/GDSL hydrolase family protein [Pedobacter arcticus]
MKILFFLGLGSCLFFGGCSKKSDATIITKTEPPVLVVGPIARDLTYLALGDSYTIGQSVETSQNFPNQLVDQLKRAGLNITPKIIAQTGWTTTNLKGAIASATLAPKYDFVTLLIGVNNQYQGGDVNNYRKEFGELLQTSIQYAGGNASSVVVLSIPDYSVTPFAGNNPNITSRIATEIDAYNQINKEETEKLKVNYLDITSISREAKNNRNLISTDGLHPSATMYQEWVKLLAPLVLANLK